MPINLRETVFHIEKLRNIVGIGNCSAFQICTAPGRPLGRLGWIAESEIRMASNQDSFEAAGTNKTTMSWFTRMLRALKT